MISRCQQDDYCCTNTSCRVHNIYAEISYMVRDKLDSYNFANFKGIAPQSWSILSVLRVQR